MDFPSGVIRFDLRGTYRVMAAWRANAEQPCLHTYRNGAGDQARTDIKWVSNPRLIHLSYPGTYFFHVIPH
jgi:hypothetical protein